MVDYIERLFGHIEINLNIEFMLAILGIILGLLSLRPRRTKDKKKIEVKQADNDLLLKIPEGFGDNIKVLFDNEVMADLYELTVYLQNSGTEVLKAEDFHRKCSISFGRDVNVKRAKLQTDDEFTEAIITTSDQYAEIEIGLLEQLKYLKIDILYQSELKGDIKFESNIIGGERIRSDLQLYNRFEHYIGEKKDFNGWVIVTLILGGAAWVIELFIIENALGIDVFDSDFNVIIPYGWFALLFGLPVIIALALFRNFFLNRQPWLGIKKWTDLK